MVSELAICHNSCLLHFSPGILLASPLPDLHFSLCQFVSEVPASRQSAICVIMHGPISGEESLRVLLNVFITMLCVERTISLSCLRASTWNPKSGDYSAWSYLSRDLSSHCELVYEDILLLVTVSFHLLLCILRYMTVILWGDCMLREALLKREAVRRACWRLRWSWENVEA